MILVVVMLACAMFSSAASGQAPQAPGNPAGEAQFVGLGVLSLERSGTILIMLIIGGVGQLYGAFIGVPLYMIAQDRFSEVEPVYWYFWIGLLMVIVVVFARGGILGLIDRLRR
jgi:branched-chain amino acid transport system permease protein